MSPTPPNPFDPAEVQKYLDTKAAAEVEKNRRAEALADKKPAEGETSPAEVMGNADLMGADSPAAEAVTMLNYWASQGPNVYAEAVGAIVDAVTSTAAELEDVDTPELLDPDAVVVSARLGKAIQDAGKKLYYAGRVALWHIAGRSAGRHTTPGGATYRFKLGSRTTTRVNSKKLKADYPEIYKAVTTTTAKSDDTPGTLYL